ncbi:MAG: RHS repeat protein [Acidobacteriota bacterium]|nr:RHS repeat protein [Acidobacteriota bacterium]
MIRFTAFFLTTALAFGAVNYSYDAAGRLAKVDYGNGKSVAYTYDNAGNLLTRTASSGAAASPNREKPAAVKKKNVTKAPTDAAAGATEAGGSQTH